LSERVRTSIEYSVEKQLKMNDSKLMLLLDAEDSDESDEEEIMDVAHLNTKHNNQYSFEATERVNEN
jgi:hypothetical protein